MPDRHGHGHPFASLANPVTASTRPHHSCARLDAKSVENFLDEMNATRYDHWKLVTKRRQLSQVFAQRHLDL